MQVSIETTSVLERRLAIEISAEKIDSRVDKRLREAAKTVRINGFRKGKVPLSIIDKQYSGTIRQQVLSDIINSSLENVFIKEKIQPVNQPRIEINQFETGKDLKYTANFEVYPQITVSKLNLLLIEKITAQIYAEDIEKMMHTLRVQKATYTVVKRAAADGDRVNMSYFATQGGKEYSEKTKNQDLVLGSGSMIPGFEEGLIGMSADEKKNLLLNFSENDSSGELKDTHVEFAVTLHSVSEKRIPIVDSSLLEQFGVTHGNIEKFHADILKNMERELRSAIKNKTKTAVMNQLLETNSIPIPKSLIAVEVKALREQMIQQFSTTRRIEEVDLASSFPDARFIEEAERRVALGLLLGEIIKMNKLVVGVDAIRAAVEELSSSYENPEKIVDHYYQTPELLSSVESSVLEDMAVDSILQQATVTEKTVTYEEAVRQEG